MEYGAINRYHGYNWGVASPSLLTFAFHHTARSVVLFHQVAFLMVVCLTGDGWLTSNYNPVFFYLPPLICVCMNTMCLLLPFVSRKMERMLKSSVYDELLHSQCCVGGSKNLGSLAYCYFI